MNTDVALKIVREAKRQGAQDCIAAVEEEENSQIKYSNSRIVNIQKGKSVDIGIFLAIDKRPVITSLKDIKPNTIKKTIRELVSFAKKLDTNEDYYGIADGPFKYKKNDSVDKTLSHSGEKCVDLVRDAISISKNEGMIKSAGVLETVQKSTFLATSGNVIAQNGFSNVYFSIRNFSRKNGSGHSVCCSRRLKDIKIKEAVVEACTIAKLSENAIEGKAGVYDLILEPLPFANLLENIGQAASIFSVETGFSWLNDKLNKKVANDSFTLYDDAVTKNGVGSIKFDAEGVPITKKPIIKNGILKNYLHNTSTAKKYKTKTTANAGIISPEPLCLVVEKGNVNKSSMISSVKHGLIITNVWYTRFQNYATGDFSTIPRDGILEIKNGKIAGAVKGIRISDNITRMLMNISAVENKRKWILGWEVSIPILTPSVLIRKAKITKSVD